MFEILLENIYAQLLTVGLILASVYFQLKGRQIKLNEPPIVDYQYPIIGHTWSFTTNCKKLISESRKKHGETFSLYIFGQVVTITGKEMAYEVFNKNNEFSFYRGTDTSLVMDYVLPHAAMDINKTARIFRTFFKMNIGNITGLLQQNISNSMENYIGECVEPKVISIPYNVFLKIFSRVSTNIIIDDQCAQHEEVIELFENFTNLVVSVFFAPKILSFIHPWIHEQFAMIPLKFISRHRTVITKHIRPVIERRFREKAVLGDDWVPPSDALQVCLDDPEIAPDLNPNNVDYNFIVDLIGLFIFTSMSSTPNFASYILYEMAKRKEYWQELCQEAQEINKQCNGKLKADDLDKMVKLDSFIKEALRLNSNLLNLPRKCVTESHYTFSDGYQIPSGRMVYINSHDISFDEKFHGQNPKEFNLHRHLESDSPATKLEPNLLIFGYGKHACPGRYFAVNVFKIIFHKILLKYNIKPVNENVEYQSYVGFSLMLMKGEVVFENRN